MIPLQRAPKPDYLTDEKVQELTKQYQLDTKKTVWNRSEIKEPLLESSNKNVLIVNVYSKRLILIVK